jgi:hypothetical protein
VLFTVYRLHEVPTLPNPNGDSGNFANLIRLNQIESGTAAAGEMLPVMLTWTILNDLPEDGQGSAVFVHLEDQTGHRWSQVDQDAYPAEQWRRVRLSWKGSTCRCRQGYHRARTVSTGPAPVALVLSPASAGRLLMRQVTSLATRSSARTFPSPPGRRPTRCPSRR